MHKSLSVCAEVNAAELRDTHANMDLQIEQKCRWESLGRSTTAGETNLSRRPKLTDYSGPQGFNNN